jgi:hypothetical protein
MLSRRDRTMRFADSIACTGSAPEMPRSKRAEFKECLLSFVIAFHTWAGGARFCFLDYCAGRSNHFEIVP